MLAPDKPGRTGSRAACMSEVGEMLYVDSTAQRNVMNVNLFIVLDDGELWSVHTGGTITSIDWDALLAGDMAQEHLAITHQRFSTSSEK